jgi:hypothetical protein
MRTSGRTPGTREIERIYRLLDEPPTDFDCGTLCIEEDGPLCCVTENAVPSVYRWEWRYLKERTDMWHLWRPRTRQERRDFMDCKADCDIYVKCEGAARCDRRYRSFVCRTFPLEPYVENDWTMSGLVFNTDFEGKCPLTRRPRKIRPEFVHACLEGWQWLLEVEPEMHEVYRDWSQVLRRRCGQLNQNVRGFDLDGRWTVLRPKRPGPSRKGRPRPPR